MAAGIGPRDLTTFGYAVGENGWGSATNTSLQTLDALCQVSVISTVTTSPPSLGSSDDGKAYIIPSGATGAWSGKTGYIAVWTGAAWTYFDPTTGGTKTWLNWLAYDQNTSFVFVHGGSGSWSPIGGQANYGAYSSRPAAATKLTGTYYLATDIGINGATFFCNGSTWVHVGVTRLFALTTSVAITSTTETSIFGTGTGTVTLPNNSVGQGTNFLWGFDGLGSGGSGTNSFADVKIKEYIGSTAVGDSGSLAVGIQGTYACRGTGAMICRTTGVTGTVMGSGRYEKMLDTFSPIGQSIATNTATTVDTTGSISPNVKITLANLVNSPTLTVDNSWIDVSGLV
jgi:hypothetical protein